MHLALEIELTILIFLSTVVHTKPTVARDSDPMDTPCANTCFSSSYTTIVANSCPSASGESAVLSCVCGSSGVMEKYISAIEQCMWNQCQISVTPDMTSELNSGATSQCAGAGAGGTANGSVPNISESVSPSLTVPINAGSSPSINVSTPAHSGKPNAANANVYALRSGSAMTVAVVVVSLLLLT
ncbi:hypothetical protein B0H11DRAFT_2135918 [Mycena galericulata]|nr:hypothetical protein B0H11DRAFT_2135918 [Mycena galericulata]